MSSKFGSFTILKDTREQDGWLWPSEIKKPGKFQCLGTVIQGLSTADYTIEGYEDQILIERKNGFSELFGNMIPKSNKERFEREMERLKHVPYKYLVIETNINNDLLGLSVPQMTRGPTCSKVFEWIIELQQTYGIVPIFAGDAGTKVVRKIFENFLRKVHASNV